MPFRVGCCRFWKWQTGAILPEYAQSAPISGLLPGPLYRSYEVRVWPFWRHVAATAGKPTKAIRSIHRNHSEDPFLSLEFRQIFVSGSATDAGCCRDDAAGSGRNRNRKVVWQTADEAGAIGFVSLPATITTPIARSVAVSAITPLNPVVVRWLQKRVCLFLLQNRRKRARCVKTGGDGN